MARASYSSRAAWLEAASPVRVWPRSTPQGLHATPEEPYRRASRQDWRRKHADARRCHVPLWPISAAVSNLPQMSEGGRRVAPLHLAIPRVHHSLGVARRTMFAATAAR